MPCLLAVLADGSAEILHARLASEAGINSGFFSCEVLKGCRTFSQHEGLEKENIRKKISQVSEVGFMTH